MISHLAPLRLPDERPKHVPPSVIAAVTFAATIARCYLPEATAVTSADRQLAARPSFEITYLNNTTQLSSNNPIQLTVAPNVTIHAHAANGGFIKASTGVERVSPAVDARSRFGRRERAAGLFTSAMSQGTALKRAPGMRLDPEPAASHMHVSPPAPARTTRSILEHRPIERLLQRRFTPDNVTAADERMRPLAEGVREAAWGPTRIPPVEQQPITLAAPEVRRVAEQVIREIDHRLIAWRERSGKR